MYWLWVGLTTLKHFINGLIDWWPIESQHLWNKLTMMMEFEEKQETLTHVYTWLSFSDQVLFSVSWALLDNHVQESYQTVLCLISRTTTVIARATCVFRRRAQKGTPGLTHKGCDLQRVILGHAQVMSWSFLGWDKVYVTNWWNEWHTSQESYTGVEVSCSSLTIIIDHFLIRSGRGWSSHGVLPCPVACISVVFLFVILVDSGYFWYERIVWVGIAE